MRPQKKGMTKEDIERVLNFDWDASTDEESEDELEEISAMLEQNLKGIVETGERIEIGLRNTGWFLVKKDVVDYAKPELQ